ncbi:Predicted protein, partial [Gryllus bimaculatus]
AALLPDGVTERLVVFDAASLDDLRLLLRRFLYVFQEEAGPGCLCLLYSAVLTRGIDRVHSSPNTFCFDINRMQWMMHCKIHRFELFNVIKTDSLYSFINRRLQYLITVFNDVLGYLFQKLIFHKWKGIYLHIQMHG